MGRKLRALLLFFMTALGSPSGSDVVASVTPVFESFDGTGSHMGFENPDWSIFEIDGEFVNDGFSATAISMSREIDGAGSFRTTINLSKLDLDDVDGNAPPGTAALLSLRHTIGPDIREGLIVVELVEAQTSPPGEWLFSFASRASGGIQFHGVPQAASALSLVFDFNAVPSELFATYEFESDGSTFEATHGPFEFNGEIGNKVDFEFVVTAGGDIPDYLNPEVVLRSLAVTPTSNIPGDFDASGALDVADLEQLNVAIRTAEDNPEFDLTGDNLVDDSDLRFWVHDLAQTYFGDANLDGEFASSDLINVFTAGEYEDGIKGNSTWAGGDWTGDADFTSSDLVLAFTDGGYEQGPRVANPVPEPEDIWSLLVGIAVICSTHRITFTPHDRLLPIGTHAY